MTEEAPHFEDSKGGFSAGLLARVLDRRLLWIKSRTIGTTFDNTARRIKVAGDIGLLVIAGVWLGQSIYREAAQASPGGGNATNTSIPVKAAPAKSGASPAQLFADKVEPLLKARCHECHGPKKQSSKLNLSVRDKAGEVRGLLAVVDTGSPEKSELLKRVVDKDDPMPPKDKGAMLKADEVDALRQWIAGGAPAGAAGSGGGSTSASPATSRVNAKVILAIGRTLLTGLLVVFLVLVIHYVTGRFFDANDSVIAASTPSHISRATVPGALAVLFWILAVGVLLMALVKAATLALADIRAHWFAAVLNLLLGGVLFAFALALARLFVADDFLNIKASTHAHAGDEALGILSLLIKVGLKMAPVYYGLCLALGSLFINLDRLWPQAAPPASQLLMGDTLYAALRNPGLSLSSLGMDASIPTVVLLPVLAYFGFLIAFLAVEFVRAVLHMSRKLGSR